MKTVNVSFPDGAELERMTAFARQYLLDHPEDDDSGRGSFAAFVRLVIREKMERHLHPPARRHDEEER